MGVGVAGTGMGPMHARLSAHMGTHTHKHAWTHTHAHKGMHMRTRARTQGHAGPGPGSDESWVQRRSRWRARALMHSDGGELGGGLASATEPSGAAALARAHSEGGAWVGDAGPPLQPPPEAQVSQCWRWWCMCGLV